MNALLLIAHAPLASALREAALHVFADAAPDIVALDVSAHEAPEHTLARAQAALHALAPRPVLILTDLFGATPCNVAQRLSGPAPTRLLTGANLPMLLRALTYRREPLDGLLQRAADGGAQGILALPASAAPQHQPRRATAHDSNRHHHQQ